MKLMTKSMLYLVATIVVVFIVSGIIAFYWVDAMFREEVDESLVFLKDQFLLEVTNSGGFENLDFKYSNQTIIEISQNYSKQVSIRDTTLQAPFEEEIIRYRYIKFYAETAGQVRQIHIIKSIVDFEDLAEGIFAILLLIFVTNISAIVLLNYYGMSRLFKPFRNILTQMRQFDFHKKEGLKLVQTDILEFSQLGTELVTMTNKLIGDYYALKEFSENASHEFQTPISIIRSNLEVILQQDDKNPNRQELMAVYKAVNRLSRLQKDLSLLTRIENREFTQQTGVRLDRLINDQIEMVSELIALKKIKLTIDKTEPITISGNATLLEIMISNLLNNAIKHNIENGKIHVELDSASLQISNSGEDPKTDPNQFFNRFQKGNQNSETLGLGLSIVQKIVELHGFKIEYTYSEYFHRIAIKF